MNVLASTLPFVGALALVACSNASSLSGDTSGTRADSSSSSDAGHGPANADTEAESSADDEPADAGSSSDRDASSGPDGGSPSVVPRPSVRLQGSDYTCDVISTPSGVYFATANEIRRVEDPNTGETSLVSAAPAFSTFSCSTLALVGAKLYIAGRSDGGTTGALYAVSLPSGTANLIAKIPAAAPAGEDVYPLATDGTDLFVAASPNVWHLPVTAQGSLTKLAIGASNFYPSGLALAGSSLYSYADGSSPHLTRFPKAGGSDSAVSSPTHVRRAAFVIAGAALFFGSDSDPVRTIDLAYAKPSNDFAPTGSIALATDGADLYVNEVVSGQSPVKSTSIGVYSLATGVHVASYSTTQPIANSPSTYHVEFEAPLAVDSGHIYVRENNGKQDLLVLAK
jgi:hypothetical protein